MSPKKGAGNKSSEEECVVVKVVTKRTGNQAVKEHAAKAPTQKRGRPASPKPSSSDASGPSPSVDRSGFKKIKSVKKVSGELIYTCEWKDGSEKLIHEEEVYDRCPAEAIEFLDRIVFDSLKVGEELSLEDLINNRK